MGCVGEFVWRMADDVGAMANVVLALDNISYLQGPWQLCWSGGDEEQEAHTLESLSKNVQKKEIVDPLLITESLVSPQP